MKGICNLGCNKIFENPTFKEEKVKADIRKVYFKCPHCGKEYICFYTNKEIRKLQALQRKARNTEEFNKLKEKVTNKMNKLKEEMREHWK